MIARFAEDILTVGVVAALERVLVIQDLDSAQVLSGMAAVDRPQAQRQWPVLAHRITAQVPAVQVCAEALRVEATSGFCPQHADAPGVVDRPICTHQNALVGRIQAGSAALAIEATFAAEVFHPEVAVSVGGQFTQGRQHSVAQLLGGALGGRRQVGVLAAGQLLKRRAECAGFLREFGVEFFQGLDLLGAQLPRLQQASQCGLQHIRHLQAVVRGGLPSEMAIDGNAFSLG